MWELPLSIPTLAWRSMFINSGLYEINFIISFVKDLKQKKFKICFSFDLSLTNILLSPLSKGFPTSHVFFSCSRQEKTKHSGHTL